MEGETETHLYAVKTRDDENAFVYETTSAELAAKKHVKEHVGETRLAEVISLIPTDEKKLPTKLILVTV